jgi:pimeloyl-ACP methyl ester carboxylesterase
MARDLPVDFLRWAARAAVEWDGCPDPGVPVRQIHGDRDWVIPVARLKPDTIVAGGLHVLNMSHPAEVNAFIAAACENSAPPAARSPLKDRTSPTLSQG